MTLKKTIKHLLIHHPRGLTYAKLSEMTGHTEKAVSARMSELKRAGLVFVDRTIHGDNGRPRNVFKHVNYQLSECQHHSHAEVQKSAPVHIPVIRRKGLIARIWELMKLKMIGL